MKLKRKKNFTLMRLQTIIATDMGRAAAAAAAAVTTILVETVFLLLY